MTETRWGQLDNIGHIWEVPFKNEVFVGQVGNLDLYRCPANDEGYMDCDDQGNEAHLLVACNPDIAARVGRYNWTCIHVTKDCRLIFSDDDVVPTPYELALLYQYAEGIQHQLIYNRDLNHDRNHDR